MSQDLVYKNKYLKYKMKYLELKNQLGGADFTINDFKNLYSSLTNIFKDKLIVITDEWAKIISDYYTKPTSTHLNRMLEIPLTITIIGENTYETHNLDSYTYNKEIKEFTQKNSDKIKTIKIDFNTTNNYTEYISLDNLVLLFKNINNFIKSNFDSQRLIPSNHQIRIMPILLNGSVGVPIISMYTDWHRSWFPHWSNHVTKHLHQSTTISQHKSDKTKKSITAHTERIHKAQHLPQKQSNSPRSPRSK
jgi:hypothetical protein